METTFASRVKQFRDSKGLAQAAFAERCGLTQGNVSQMEQGTEPKQSNVSKILIGFPDLNPDWLLTGEGEMLREGKALKPFLPGGEVNGFGATVVPRGGLAASLGANFGEDAGQPMHAKAPVKTQQDFIQSLLLEAETLRTENRTLLTVVMEQRDMVKNSQNTINSQQQTILFLQEQVQQLQLAGKSEGNQYYAPVIGMEEEQPRPVVMGLRRYELPEATAPATIVSRLKRRKRRACKVIALHPAEQPERAAA